MNYRKIKEFIISEKGASLLFAFFILVFVSTIAFGLSTIILSHLRVSREIGYSVVSFYAADSGIEEVLYDDRKLGTGGNKSDCFSENDACYEVIFSSNGGTTIDSRGSYKDSRRAIEVRY